VVIQTEQLRPWTRQWLAAERVKVIPNPVAPTVSGTMNLADLFQHSEKVIVAMGRLDACKGFDLLIDAFSMAAPTRDNWALLILGGGEERESLARQVDALGLSGKVLLPGEVANPAGLLRQCEIFVLSSRYEGFPNALCEAMASGLPPISFDCKYGPSEIITDGENGILVPSGDVKALSAALMKMMDDPSLRERIRKNARGILEKYGFSAIMDEWDALFARAVSR
jgi:glycosyltransferase involved in cell wall biosynthesis